MPRPGIPVQRSADTDTMSDVMCADLSAADQLVGGAAPDVQDFSQLEHREHQRQFILLIFHGITSNHQFLYSVILYIINMIKNRCISGDFDHFKILNFMNKTGVMHLVFRPDLRAEYWRTGYSRCFNIISPCSLQVGNNPRTVRTLSASNTTRSMPSSSAEKPSQSSVFSQGHNTSRPQYP